VYVIGKTAKQDHAHNLILFISTIQYKSRMYRLILLFVSILAAMTGSCYGFLNAAMRRHAPLSMMSLDGLAISKLDEMKTKYDRLAALVSPEAETERASLADVVEKYSTYKEIKSMMGKLRVMWKSEASDRRRDKQLKSFIRLYEGKIELEEILKQKLGIPSLKMVTKDKALEDLARYDAEIAELEKKVDSVSVKMTPGSSTREQRFGY
jgi:hypothetical protein